MGIPDEQIHPTATGEATKLVAAHQEPQDLVFYAGWFCPYVQRSWITLEERGIPYQYKEVNPYKKEPHFLAINPKGLVPAVEYGGKAIYESLIICEFLEDAYPEYKPHLLPEQPIDKAIARIWLDFISKSFIPPNQRLIQAQEKEKQDAARSQVYDALRTFSEKIKGPYFFGEEFSLVDVAIAPWVVRDYITTEHRGFKREEVGEKWVKYAAAIEKRDSIIKTSSLKEHYTEIYGRYLRDEAQSEAAKATREGRVIP
ncbi:glutathione-S-transferase [Cyathus striatus]|nr:glutathione-S-transferase [Cyathus striatus]